MTNIGKLKQSPFYAALYALKEEIKNIQIKRLGLLAEFYKLNKEGRMREGGSLMSRVTMCNVSELGCNMGIELIEEKIQPLRAPGILK
jgi:hypothetical protein